ncbi:shikimate dehydrogenase [Falsigemmobacter intermedius]|uniref:Shikimate dehydrogenase n=1 Tax=Falsigemmobacter intermedius TaxID=1553448 RepID=A0A3S4XL23_9RHOB|nr:shikimate dehydrogenase [Falsigemmobacter intermedius]RWY38451.1 shikimate dehydrogenase [Falsigemmobacter intermedius]
MLQVALIGSGIGRSRSPALHMAEARAQGFALDYALIDLQARGLSAAALPDLLAEAEAAGLSGVNITHPCKQQVMACLDEMSPDARALGAVNTVVFRNGRRIGYNTDWSGFFESFRRGLPGVPLTEVLQMGAGGAGAAVAHACLALGVGRLYLQDAAPGRAAQLAEALNARAGRTFATPVGHAAEVTPRINGLINTTPMGMAAHPGMALDPALLDPRHWVAEIVYFPLETELLRVARALGCRTLDGGGMAVFQAVGAFELFTTHKAEPERMLAHFATLPPP